MNELQIFSVQEMNVIKIIRANKNKRGMSLSDLARKNYGNNMDDHEQLSFGPAYSGSVMSVTVKRINTKCARHDLPWFINGVGLGRGGRYVWLDKRV